MNDNAVTRFLGGRPGAVALKLAIVSIVVGALLHFAGLSPAGLIRGLGRMVESLIGSGWDAVRTVAEFALHGATIVVARLMASRKGS
jgi:hypothetical protein